MDVHVKILKWEKFNPRKDIKRPHWFALSNELVEDDDFFNFSHAEFKAWIYLLSKASKKQSPEIDVNFEAAFRKSKITENDFEDALEKLMKLQVIEVTRERERTRSVRDPNAHVTSHYITLQDTTEQNMTEHLSSKGAKFARKRSAKAAAPKIEGVGELSKLYCDLWKLSYKSDRSPDIRGKDLGILKNLIHDLGKDRVEVLLRGYLSMRDSWFITKSHDLATLVTNLNKVALFSDNSGRIITRSEITQIDKSQTNQNTLDALRNGEI